MLQARAGDAAEVATLSLQTLLRYQCAKKFFPKSIVPDRVLQNETRVPAEPRNDCMWRIAPGPVRIRAKRDLNGQRVVLRRAFEITHFEKPHSRRICFARNRNLFRDLHRANRPRLRTKPAATANVIRQNLALEQRALLVRDQRGDIRLDPNRRHRALITRARCGGLRSQQEPVMRMRSERNRVWRSA